MSFSQIFISDGPHEATVSDANELKVRWMDGEFSSDALVRSGEETRSLSDLMPYPGSSEHNAHVWNRRLRIILLKVSQDEFDFLGLPGQLRSELQNVVTQLAKRPIAAWTDREKSVFRYWQSLRPEEISSLLAQLNPPDTKAAVETKRKELAELKYELRAIAAQCEKTKWAVRGIGILIALVIFGVIAAR